MARKNRTVIDTTAPPADKRLVIGWKEFVDFPEWGVRRVKVKVDTGARTSALGVLSYDLREHQGRGLFALLRLALRRKHPEQITDVEVPVQGMAIVANSNGMREQRPVIETALRLGPVTKRVRVTLTNRSGLRFCMILGRTALEGDFVVDVSRKYLMKNR